MALLVPNHGQADHGGLGGNGIRFAELYHQGECSQVLAIAELMADAEPLFHESGTLLVHSVAPVQRDLGHVNSNGTLDIA
jgi:hypothetical protein